MTKEQKDLISKSLEENKFAVITTNSSIGYPSSAIIGFSTDDEGRIIFRSLSNSRKNQNIKKDGRVSLVVLWDNKEWKTLQIEGDARLLTKEESLLVEEKHCQKNKAYEAYKNNELNEYFAVEILWARYCDMTVNPMDVWEIKK
jgi:general stress protein 26